MSVYVYERDGKRIEREFPIGQAPSSVRVGRLKYTRSLPHVAHIGISGNFNRRPIDFVSTQLDYATYGKFHKGHVVKDEHGERHLHFSSLDEAEHLRRAFNESAESERLGRKLRRYGDCDEYADDIRRGHQRENEDGTGNDDRPAWIRRKEFVEKRVRDATAKARRIRRARNAK